MIEAGSDRERVEGQPSDHKRPFVSRIRVVAATGFAVLAAVGMYFVIPPHEDTPVVPQSIAANNSSISSDLQVFDQAIKSGRVTINILGSSIVANSTQVVCRELVQCNPQQLASSFHLVDSAEFKREFTGADDCVRTGEEFYEDDIPGFTSPVKGVFINMDAVAAVKRPATFLFELSIHEGLHEKAKSRLTEDPSGKIVQIEKGVITYLSKPDNSLPGRECIEIASQPWEVNLEEGLVQEETERIIMKYDVRSAVAPEARHTIMAKRYRDRILGRINGDIQPEILRFHQNTDKETIYRMVGDSVEKQNIFFRLKYFFQNLITPNLSLGKSVLELVFNDNSGR